MPKARHPRLKKLICFPRTKDFRYNPKKKIYTCKCRAPYCHRRTNYTYFCCDHHLKKNYGLVVRPSDKKEKGLGLFAEQHFKKDEILSFFGGELLKSKKELDERYPFIGAEETASYVLRLEGRAYLDESRARSPAAYTNDPLDFEAFRKTDHRSEADYRRCIQPVPANCFVESYEDTAILIAKRDIVPGEELLWEYGYRYWGGDKYVVYN
jgi:hypothetical protein